MSLDLIDDVSESTGTKLLQALVLQLKNLPEPWDKMPKFKQDTVIDSLRGTVGEAVRNAVQRIAADERAVATGLFEHFAVKNSVRTFVNIPLSNIDLNILARSRGKSILLVFADEESHLEGMDSVTGQSDQRAMDLGHEYTDQDGDGMDAGETESVIDEDLYNQAHDLVRAHNRCSTTFIRQELGIGSDKANIILSQLEFNGVVTAKDDTGTRQVIQPIPAEAACEVGYGTDE